MVRVSPKDRESNNAKHKRRMRSSTNKFLKPGALAQLRYSKALDSKSCSDLGKKRVAVFDAKVADCNDVIQDNAITGTPKILSPERVGFSSPLEPAQMIKHNSVQRTPKTPHADNCQSESRLEALPMDFLVKILCHLHHDQLRAVFHVSQRIRNAVMQARQFYFNYTTPDRTRQEMLQTMTPLHTEHWPFVSKKDGKSTWIPSPHSPKAPSHGPRPPRIKCTDVRQITAVLFQESTFPPIYMMSSVIPKPLCKSVASNRVLFYEEELCQAVAQNKLL